MTADPDDELVAAFASYIGAQRRLLGLLTERMTASGAAGLVRTAELDQLAAVVHQALHRQVPRPRGDPGG